MIHLLSQPQTIRARIFNHRYSLFVEAVVPQNDHALRRIEGYSLTTPPDLQAIVGWKEKEVEQFKVVAEPFHQ
jgi:hypothetical protein